MSSAIYDFVVCLLNKGTIMSLKHDDEAPLQHLKTKLWYRLLLCQQLKLYFSKIKCIKIGPNPFILWRLMDTMMCNNSQSDAKWVY